MTEPRKNLHHDYLDEDVKVSKQNNKMEDKIDIK